MSGPRVQIKFTGLEEYVERLRKANANIDDIIEEAVRESAKPVFEDIKKWAEKHKRTGAVLEGLEMSPVRNIGGKIYLWLGIDTVKSPNAWHATFVEYGTPRVKADPGISNAFKKNLSKIRKIQKEVIERRGGLL
jgi:HK97 gp10 family phage protein